MDRDTFVQASSQVFPGLERWTRWCYTQSPLLGYITLGCLSLAAVFSKVILWDPSTCCGLQSIVDRISALSPTYQKWYMDDGGIVGSKQLLLQVWEILKSMGRLLASAQSSEVRGGPGSIPRVACLVLLSCSPVHQPQSVASAALDLCH